MAVSSNWGWNRCIDINFALGGDALRAPSNQRFILNLAETSYYQGIYSNTQQTQNICILHLYNVGPTSSTLDQRCVNVIKCCVCWVDINNEPVPLKRNMFEFGDDM